MEQKEKSSKKLKRKEPKVCDNCSAPRKGNSKLCRRCGADLHQQRKKEASLFRQKTSKATKTMLDRHVNRIFDQIKKKQVYRLQGKGFHVTMLLHRRGERKTTRKQLLFGDEVLEQKFKVMQDGKLRDNPCWEGVQRHYYRAAGISSRELMNLANPMDLARCSRCGHMGLELQPVKTTSASASTSGAPLSTTPASASMGSPAEASDPVEVPMGASAGVEVPVGSSWWSPLWGPLPRRRLSRGPLPR